MRLAILGTGYVGLVTGTCMADSGNDVVCIDKDKGKIDVLRINTQIRISNATSYFVNLWHNLCF